MFGQSKKQLKVGDQAPLFSGTTQDGKTLQLKDFLGKKVALYFYPKDNTSGCTKQACSLRDHYANLQKAGYAVIGVSNDSVDSHQRFSEKHELPFPLIADTNREITDAYGTSRRFLWFPKRTTFIINEKGYIERIIKRINTTNHAEEILNG
ncbi:MAG: peroxiredoxin [Bacteroidota bacterium]